jgi:hypothetical protein
MVEAGKARTVARVPPHGLVQRPNSGWENSPNADPNATILSIFGGKLQLARLVK